MGTEALHAIIRGRTAASTRDVSRAVEGRYDDVCASPQCSVETT